MNIAAVLPWHLSHGCGETAILIPSPQYYHEIWSHPCGISAIPIPRHSSRINRPTEPSKRTLPSHQADCGWHTHIPRGTSIVAGQSAASQLFPWWAKALVPTCPLPVQTPSQTAKLSLPTVWPDCPPAPGLSPPFVWKVRHNSHSQINPPRHFRVNKWVVSCNQMAATSTVVAPSGERLWCNGRHGVFAVQQLGWASHNGALYKSTFLFSLSMCKLWSLIKVAVYFNNTFIRT